MHELDIVHLTVKAFLLDTVSGTSKLSLEYVLPRQQTSNPFGLQN